MVRSLTLKTFSRLVMSFGILGLSAQAHAITLDNFSDYAPFQPRGEIRTGWNTNTYASMLQTGSGIFGGTRSVELRQVSPTGGLTTGFEGAYAGDALGNGALPHFISHGSSSTGRGSTLLTYDGDDEIGLTSFNSFVLDLTAGGADRLTFEYGYDLPHETFTSSLEFTFYDASDATGNTFSRGILNLDRRTTDAGVFVPGALLFSSLNIHGSSGAANLANIGAFSVLLNGNDAIAADIVFTNFGTNGATGPTPVPEPTSMALLSLAAAGVCRKRIRARRF